jgi:hypothetical protein
VQDGGIGGSGEEPEKPYDDEHQLETSTASLCDGLANGSGL